MTNAQSTPTAMTTREEAYVVAYCNVIRCVANVERYVTSAHRSQIDAFEAEIGEQRSDELRETARRRMGL